MSDYGAAFLWSHNHRGIFEDKTKQELNNI